MIPEISPDHCFISLQPTRRQRASSAEAERYVQGTMRLFFAIAYLLLLSAYGFSHFYDLTGRALEVRDYAESLALYIFL